jgi:hypothetical protein
MSNILLTFFTFAKSMQLLIFLADVSLLQTHITTLSGKAILCVLLHVAAFFLKLRLPFHSHCHTQLGKNICPPAFVLFPLLCCRGMLLGICSS